MLLWMPATTSVLGARLRSAQRVWDVSCGIRWQTCRIMQRKRATQLVPSPSAPGSEVGHSSEPPRTVCGRESVERQSGTRHAADARHKIDAVLAAEKRSMPESAGRRCGTRSRPPPFLSRNKFTLPSFAPNVASLLSQSPFLSTPQESLAAWPMKYVWALSRTDFFLNQSF